MPRAEAPGGAGVTVSVPHRLQVRSGVTAVRERIERVLGITTTAQPEGDMWAIYFAAPADADFDFLRPDVLPPKIAGPLRPRSAVRPVFVSENMRS